MAGAPKSRGYVSAWLTLAKVKQADLVRLLGYSKAKAHAIWHGDQRLNEDTLEEIAPLAHARPYELLMEPEAAMRYRRLEAALRDASKVESPPEVKAPEVAPHRHRKAG